jgi:hypothetical protein
MEDSKSWWWFEKYLVPPIEYCVYPRKNPINYTVNSYNYRCPEFDTIDWEKSIVVLGGSDFFGEGIEDENLCSTVLQRKTGWPVINLASPAASNQQIVLTMAMLSRHYKPRCWIVGWCDVYRWMHWDTKQSDPEKIISPRGPHKEFCHKPFPQLADALPWYSSQARVTALAIAGNRMLEFGQGAWEQSKEWGITQHNFIDAGVVENHSGDQTQNMFAEIAIKEITERGW